MDIDDNKGLDEAEFTKALQPPSGLGGWVQSLPLASLLVDALPRTGPGDARSPLRAVSELAPAELAIVAREFAAGLERMLGESVGALRQSFARMDGKMRSLEDCKRRAASKFSVTTEMKCGAIEDFHRGLVGRIGAAHLDFENAMRSEHCAKGGSQLEFTTGNYAITSTPRREWRLVVDGERLDPGPDMRFNRRVPDVDALMGLDVARRARLSRAEVIAVVLYTGPMYFVYNCILRRWPEDLYGRFRDSGNLFCTTITVLVSAVQKIACVMPLKEGLTLYRGLGGSVSLPKSFFKSDENGCRGFVEWGFMSTTADKEVAIDYTEARKKAGGDDSAKEWRGSARGTLPMVLVVKVSAVDRGACIRDFSQYMEEIEYLWVPGSYLQLDGQQYLEVNEEGIIEMIPVKVNANLKADTTEGLLGRKKSMHLSAFQYRIDEIQNEIQARDPQATERLALDQSAKSDTSRYTVQNFMRKIMAQCQLVLSRHTAIAPEEYIKDSVYRGLVWEMVELQDLALSKMDEWIENTSSSFIKFRFDAQLRTVHRRRIAFQEHSKGLGKAGCLALCKMRGLIRDDVNEKNELSEARLISAAAEGRSVTELQLLVRAGADVNGTRPDGVTAIWLAAQVQGFGHTLCIKALASLKGDVNKSANDGATPVYIAAQSGNVDCIHVLAALGADVKLADKKGFTPVHQAAMNGHRSCINALARLHAGVEEKNQEGKVPMDVARDEACKQEIKRIISSNTQESANGEGERRLIVSSGDISDVDGFFALAEYSKTGADVLFIMNYPAYVGQEIADESYDKHHPGLGYQYMSDKVFASVPNPAPAGYAEFLSRYEEMRASDNKRMKAAMTDLAFAITQKVWTELPTSGHDRGSCYFCIGGINAINPFSASAVKNEIAIYSSKIAAENLSKLETEEGMIFDMEAKKIQISLMNYSQIYLDFNGSMAFLNQNWADKLGGAASAGRLKGVFVMGGVRSNTKPMTMPSIPNVLNRFSSATMNQLYHPHNTGVLFELLAEYPSIPVFTISNNVVQDLTTTAPPSPSGKQKKTMEGIDRFMESNSISGEFLKELARAHYEGSHNPPRKPFDFYAASALVSFMCHEKDGKRVPHIEMLSKQNVRQLFFCKEYGLTFVSVHETWDATLAQYISQIDTLVDPSVDDEFTKTKKDYFLKEINIMKTIPFAQSLKVHDLNFDLDPQTRKLSLDFKCICWVCHAPRS